jgi:ferredoxin
MTIRVYAAVQAVIHRPRLLENHVPASALDPTRCVRCGLCAARCPTEAVKMESFRFTEEVRFEGAPP